jgi:hypothetical protein
MSLPAKFTEADRENLRSAFSKKTLANISLHWRTAIEDFIILKRMANDGNF